MEYHAIPCNTMHYHAIPCITMHKHVSLITADGAYHCPVGSIMAMFFFAKHMHLQYFCFVLVWVLRATVGWPPWIGLSAAPRKKRLSCLHQTSSSPSLSSSSPSVSSSSPSYKHQTSSSLCFHRPCNFNSPIISLPSELPLALSISSKKIALSISSREKIALFSSSISIRYPLL